MIVRVVCLPSWELVRELKSWKHVIRRERAAAWQERRGYVVKWEEGWRRAKIGKSQALKVQRPASSGVKHIERQFRRRHRSYGLKVWEVWGKNKAPLSSFEYSKPHEKVWKRFPVRICKLKRLKKVCFQVVDRDDDREETERQESDKVFGEVWRRHLKSFLRTGCPRRLRESHEGRWPEAPGSGWPPPPGEECSWGWGSSIIVNKHAIWKCVLIKTSSSVLADWYEEVDWTPGESASSWKHRNLL